VSHDSDLRNVRSSVGVVSKRTLSEPYTGLECRFAGHSNPRYLWRLTEEGAKLREACELITRRGSNSGSGSARLDLSQKGDLPSSGDPSSFGPRSPTRAKDPNRERPRLLGTRASRVLGAKGVLP
jgi:hypothetical protein